MRKIKYDSHMFNRVADHCVICKKALTDAESIRLGYGPICSKKYLENVEPVLSNFDYVHMLLSTTNLLPEEIQVKYTKKAENPSAKTAALLMNEMLYFASANYKNRDIALFVAFVAQQLGYQSLATKLREDRAELKIEKLPDGEIWIKPKKAILRQTTNGLRVLHKAFDRREYKGYRSKLIKGLFCKEWTEDMMQTLQHEYAGLPVELFGQTVMVPDDDLGGAPSLYERINAEWEKRREEQKRLREELQEKERLAQDADRLEQEAIESKIKEFGEKAVLVVTQGDGWIRVHAPYNESFISRIRTLNQRMAVYHEGRFQAWKFPPSEKDALLSMVQAFFPTNPTFIV